MTTLYIDATGPVTCDNCGWKGKAEDCDPIEDAGQRLSAGSPVPVGECPCGSLAYLDKTPEELARERLESLAPAMLLLLRGFRDDIKLAHGTGDGDAIDEAGLDWPDLAASYHLVVGLLQKAEKNA